MTIDSKNIIKKILKNHGNYPAESIEEQDEFYPVIYSYENMAGLKTYAIFSEKKFDDINLENSLSGIQSPYVKNPILLCEDGKLTGAGENELKELEKIVNC